MDTRTGNIIAPVDYQDLKRRAKRGDKAAVAEMKFIKEMKVPPTAPQLARYPARVGRNDPCPCGSGRKFKVCCRFTSHRRKGGD